MTNFHGNEAKKNYFEKEIQNGQLKKTEFQPPPKAEQLSQKFHKLDLGWVELIDAKGIHFALPV